MIKFPEIMTRRQQELTEIRLPNLKSALQFQSNFRVESDNFAWVDLDVTTSLP